MGNCIAMSRGLLDLPRGPAHWPAKLCTEHVSFRSRACLWRSSGAVQTQLGGQHGEAGQDDMLRQACVLSAHICAAAGAWVQQALGAHHSVRQQQELLQTASVPCQASLPQQPVSPPSKRF